MNKKNKLTEKDINELWQSIINKTSNEGAHPDNPVGSGEKQSDDLLNNSEFIAEANQKN